jgi:lauroyl/myristoyl acyltransferase
LLHRYGTERLAEVERITGAPIAYRPGARETLLDALAHGTSVIGLIDVPPRLAPRGQRPVELLGRPASLPDGLLQLATDAGVPIVPCWVEVDFANGRRRVVIGEARAAAPFDAALAEIAATLDRLIRTSPAQWMFWRELNGWLCDAAPLHSA